MSRSTGRVRTLGRGLVALAIVGACGGDPVTGGPDAPPVGPATTTTSTTTTTTTTAAVTADGDGDGAPSTSVPQAAAPAAPAPTSAPALDTAAGIAAELAHVEAALRTDPPPAGEPLAELGRRQQRAFRALADRPEWDRTVLDSLEGAARDSVALTIEARRAVVAHGAGRPPTEPPTTLPAWTVRAPLPVEELLAMYRSAEAATGVPWAYLAAIHFVETRMGRIDGASPDGAVGPMQFLPTTWAECCEGDVEDPADAILGAAVYLRANGAPADLLAALDAYNPNAGYVGAVDAYARNLLADERAYLGYHGWEVYVATSAGSVRLPVGYSADAPVDVAAHLAAHPEDLEP